MGREQIGGEAYRNGFSDGMNRAHSDALFECLDEMTPQERAKTLIEWGADMNVQELIDAINQQWEEKIDKIRAEIESKEMIETTSEREFYNMALNDVLQIIDKYRKEQMGENKTIVPGKWIYEKGFTADTWECNQCHEAQTNKSKFCPSCGAKMEKEDT